MLKIKAFWSAGGPRIRAFDTEVWSGIIEECQADEGANRYGMDRQGNSRIQGDRRGMTSKNYFADEEFLCRCRNSSCPGKQVSTINPLLRSTLNSIRQKLGSPITITSAHRCPAHNKAVGGAPNSFHARYMAADLRCKPELMKRLLEIVLGETSVGGVGTADSFIHIDVRPRPNGKPTQWKYN